ncbi:MAG: Hsp20/alpha crystallin family protein [candidate division Zixibacteria bacterium]|nr:Hsp20/alpha crystallin family protein [candidate division Zixibacteria bacterium]
MRNLALSPVRFENEIDNIFNSFLNPVYSAETNAGFNPRVNIAENDDQVDITFEIPGMERGNIKVLVQDGQLTVSGERKFKEEQKEENFVRTEIRTGSFSRAFTLPDYVESEKILADYKNGLLEVTLPKKEEKKPKEIEVKIQ